MYSRRKRKYLLIAIATMFSCLLSIMNIGKANVDSLLSIVDILDKPEKIKAQIELSNHYRLQSLDKSMDYARGALENAESIDDKAGIAKANSALGSGYYYLGNYSSSLEYYEKALSQYKSIGQKEGIAFTLNNIGLIYRDWNKFEESKSNLLEALSLLKDIKHQKGIASCLNNLGTTYQASGDKERAKDYYQQAYESKREIGDKLGMANSLTNISLLLIDDQKLDSALEKFEISLKLKLESGDSLTIVNNYLNIADVHVRQGDYKKAIELAEKALQIASKANLKNWLQSAHYVLSKAYEKSGDYKKALASIKLTYDLKDSIYNEKTRKQIVDFETRLKIEKNEKEIQMLKKSKNLSNTLLLVSIITIILFMILLIVLIRLYRNKKVGMEKEEERNKHISRVNKKLSDQNWLLNTQKKKLAEMYSELNESKEQLKLSNSIKDKFFNIVANDLREPFNELKTLASDIYLRSDAIKREEAKSCAYKLKSNADNLDILVNNLLQWSKAQTESIDYNPENFDLKEVLDNTLELIKPKAENKSIKIKSNVADSAQVYGAPNMIGICLNNLLSNAIKYSYKGAEVVINIREAGNYYELEICDHGIGISNENISKLFHPSSYSTGNRGTKEKGAGLGLTICKEFVKLNGGRIWVESELAKGSSFKFTISKAIGEKKIDGLI